MKLNFHINCRSNKNAILNCVEGDYFMLQVVLQGARAHEATPIVRGSTLEALR